MVDDLKKEYLKDSWSTGDKLKLFAIILAFIAVIYGINRIHSKFMVKEY